MIALWDYLVALEAKRHVSTSTSKADRWEKAYNACSLEMAAHLRELIPTATDAQLVADLTEVAEFYEQPVDDAEMGTYDQGRAAAIQAFAIAVISVMQNHSADDRWNQLLTDFSDD